MGTISDKLNKLQNTKKAIKQAIIDKGVEVTDNDTFESYADKISSIQSGGGNDKWNELGYSAQPQFITDGINYALQIKDKFNINTKYTNDKNLIFLPAIDTSNVQYMQMMFYYCTSLLYIPHLNTSKAISMSSMFENCVSLFALDVSSFNTSNVTDMSYMFRNCASLSSLDLSSFDTSNVTNMSYMFNSCSGLTELDLSSFDTSNVTSMSNMFSYCGGLSSLDLSSFDTSNVTNMGNMFSYCGKLQAINGYLDWRKISSYPNSFYNDFSYTLRKLTIKNLGTTGTTFNFNIIYLQNWGDETDTTTYPLSVGARQSLIDSLLTYSYDRASNGLSTCTIQLQSKVKARLTSDEIAAITAKGFTIA